MLGKSIVKSIVKCSKNACKQLLSRVQKYKEDSGLDAYICLYVSEQGCSGMAYEMEFVIKPDPKDHVLEECKLCIRADSIMWILGCNIDYEVTNLEEGFVFNNPQQKQSCHCGKAFYV